MKGFQLWFRRLRGLARYVAGEFRIGTATLEALAEPSDDPEPSPGSSGRQQGLAPCQEAGAPGQLEPQSADAARPMVAKAGTSWSRGLPLVEGDPSSAAAEPGGVNRDTKTARRHDLAVSLSGDRFGRPVRVKGVIGRVDGPSRADNGALG